ncbi:MAG: UvrD-helicase domain-containing protein [Thermoanaerobaculia bacterium]
MPTWLVPESDLTPDQLRAVRFPDDRHRILYGAPGSGKTIVLLHRARHLRSLRKVPDEKLRIFVFTNVLSQYIRSALQLLEIPEDCVMTFAHWCRTFFEEEQLARLLPRTQRNQIDFKAVQQAVLARVRNHPAQYEGRFELVMVDEGQDLDTGAFEILRTIARHVTVCADPKQQIYEAGAANDAIVKALGASTASFLNAYRCSPYIAKLAGRFLEDAEERNFFLRQSTPFQGQRETPVFFKAETFEEERAKLVEMVRVRCLKGDRVGILLPQNRQVMGFAKGLTEDGLTVEVYNKAYGGRHDENGRLPDLNFATDNPKVLSYHSAKGLTFDSVLMPRLVPMSFNSFNARLVNRLLFVGITRATKWVYMSSCGTGVLQALKSAGLDDAGDDLTVIDAVALRNGGLLGAGPAVPRSAPQPEVIDDDDGGSTGWL